MPLLLIKSRGTAAVPLPASMQHRAGGGPQVETPRWGRAAPQSTAPAGSRAALRSLGGAAGTAWGSPAWVMEGGPVAPGDAGSWGGRVLTSRVRKHRTGAAGIRHEAANMEHGVKHGAWG